MTDSCFSPAAEVDIPTISRGNCILVLSCSFKVVSTFLHVGHVEISCRLLPTRFSSILVIIIKLYYCQKVIFQTQF